MYAPSFGQVKRSAAERAIRYAHGDIDKLNEIKDLVKGQKDNTDFDVVASNYSLYRYEVVKRDIKYSLSYCDDFREACEIANKCKESLANQRAIEAKRAEYDAGINAIASEILAECED